MTFDLNHIHVDYHMNKHNLTACKCHKHADMKNNMLSECVESLWCYQFNRYMSHIRKNHLDMNFFDNYIVPDSRGNERQANVL